MKYTVFGVDIAKRVFQLHWVEPSLHGVSQLLTAHGAEAVQGISHGTKRFCSVTRA
jgi:hypothetical protein